MKSFCLSTLLLISLAARSADVDTVEIYSQSMHKSFKAVVIRPASYGRVSHLMPVVYLLHGYSGKYSDWIKKAPFLGDIADKYKLIIVCPDGHFSSWYFDSPVDSSMRYETYIAKEVPAYIDSHYKVERSRYARAITGLSMGGHGALFIALRHPDIFGACGSMSGGVDLSAVTNRFDVPKRLGDTVTHADNWKNYSVSNIVEKYNKKDSLAIIIDCGTDDFFYKINHDLHEKMLKLNIPHEYIERPGRHDWKFWTRSVIFHLQFFQIYFKRDRLEDALGVRYN